MYDGNRIAFIRARWHADIVDQALKGFEDELARHGNPYVTQVFDVPGAFEMPLLAQSLAQSGQADFIVAAAFVVNGGIYRHEFVAQTVVQGLMDVQLRTNVPCLSVSLTPHHFQPTEEHTRFFHEHFVKKGMEAASAVRQLSSLSTKRTLADLHVAR